MSGLPPVVHGSSAGVFRNERNYTVVFGSGCLRRLAEFMDEHDARRPMLVTSSSITQTPLVTEAGDWLGGRTTTVFPRARQHAPLSRVEEGVRAFERGRCDSLVSLGGSSCVDVAKGIAMARGGNDLAALRGYPEMMGGRREIVHAMSADERVLPPVFAVPTTLSGAEFTYQAGLTDDASGRKDQYYHPAALPRVILLDAEACRFTPAELWLSTGVKAIDHNVERLYSLNHHPFSDALALESTRLLFGCLPSGGVTPDITSRQQALVAAWMAQFSTKNVNVGVGHAVCHQLAARFDVAHGIAAGCILPHAMRFNAEHAVMPLARLAEALGVGDTAEAAVAAVARLIADLGLPNRLRDVGVSREGFEVIATRSLTDTAITGNPRPVETADVIRSEILEPAW